MENHFIVDNDNVEKFKLFINEYAIDKPKTIRLAHDFSNACLDYIIQNDFYDILIFWQNKSVFSDIRIRPKGFERIHNSKLFERCGKIVELVLD